MRSPASKRLLRMPRPTEELRADHAVVASGLAVLGAIANHVRDGHAFPTDDAAVVLRFLREFVVGTHFRKENEIVWPAIAMRAADAEAAAVGQLMAAQDAAHDLVQSLVFFWEPAGELTEPERLGFADTVAALRAAMAQLQADEERLFLSCDRVVPADDQLDWSERFAELEAERAVRGEWQQQLRPLSARWIA